MTKENVKKDKELTVTKGMLGLMSGLALCVPMMIGECIPMLGWQKAMIILFGVIPAVFGFIKSIELKKEK